VYRRGEPLSHFSKAEDRKKSSGGLPILGHDSASRLAESRQFFFRDHTELVDDVDLHRSGGTSVVIESVAEFFVLLMNKFVGVQISFMLGSFRVRQLLDQLLVHLRAIPIQPNRMQLAEDSPIRFWDSVGHNLYLH
jgi:hypothetical protein